MILGDETAPAMAGDLTTLGDLFRRAAERRPRALAIADPANRADFTDGAPRSLTYAQADSMISAIAARLVQLGLPHDAIIGLQFPNLVEGILSTLGVLRAGMIAAPMPLLWRRVDCVSALSHVGAKALMTCGRVGMTDYSALATQTAADIFPIRFVCGFGECLSDGVIPFDDLFDVEYSEPLPYVERKGNPAAHIAVITWDVAAEGLVPVARNHAELIAGGLDICLEARVAPDATMLAAIPPANFAGISLTMMPWLLSGGTLVLHHSFDAATFSTQLEQHACDLTALPGPAIAAIAEAGLFSGSESLKALLALWRAPERIAASAPWRNPDIRFIDVAAFGETALLASRRGHSGEASPFAMGTSGDMLIAESTMQNNNLALRGPMVPCHPFPPGAERTNTPYLKISPDGFVDTGYRCREDRELGGVVITGAPAGIASVGGYRFALDQLQNVIGEIERGGIVTALPDALTGHKLAGHAGDNRALRETLSAIGFNPLVAAAFRDRSFGPDAA